MKKFERSVLVSGENPSYVYTKDQGSVIVNSGGIKLHDISVSNTEELQHLAETVSAAYLDHQRLARGEKKLAPKAKEPSVLDRKIQLVKGIVT